LIYVDAKFAKVANKFVELAVVAKEFVLVAFVTVELTPLKLFVFTVPAPIVPPVKFVTVVEARVDDPELVIFVEVKLEIEELVEVALVVVPFVAIKFVVVKFVNITEIAFNKFV
jgi:hypothetical protein